MCCNVNLTLREVPEPFKVLFTVRTHTWRDTSLELRFKAFSEQHWTDCWIFERKNCDVTRLDFLKFIIIIIIITTTTTTATTTIICLLQLGWRPVSAVTYMYINMN